MHFAVNYPLMLSFYTKSKTITSPSLANKDNLGALSRLQSRIFLHCLYENPKLLIQILKMAINPELPIQFSRTHRLQWEEVQQKNVILYPEGMVELNQSSAEILKLCNGTRNLAQIVSELEQKFTTSGLTNDITAFLEVAIQNGWINQN
jgi:pyrroloquinoline quinone biosynthesis protein D